MHTRDDHAGSDQGLRTPRGTALESMEPLPRRSRWRLVAQVVGALIGIALAFWAVSMALSEQQSESRDRIAQAPLWALGALLALTWLHIAFNGLLFRAALGARGEHRTLTSWYLIWVNAFPTLLAILPFKLGFFVRATLHHRLDRVSIKRLASWVGAFGALTLAALLPAGGAGLVTTGALWWVLLLLGPALGLLALAGVALAAQRVGLLHRLMLGAERALTDPRVLIGTYALRLLDIGAQGARFMLAAWVAGLALEPEQALLLGATYFLVGAAAPAGALGFAEIITASVAAAVGLDKGALALVVLVVSASQYTGALLMCVPATFIVRPDRALRAHAGGPLRST